MFPRNTTNSLRNRFISSFNLYVKTMNMGLVGANHSENNVRQYNSSFKANPMLLVNEIFNINSFSLTNKRNHKTDKRENC